MGKKNLIFLIIFLLAITISGWFLYYWQKEDGDQSTSQAPVFTNSGQKTGFKNVMTATKISTAKVSDAQIEFINSHYDHVLTSILDERVRQKIQGPQLFLYRSIQDGWPNFNQFDWEHMDANENMFVYDNDGDRIWTRYDSWLMDGSDLVEKGTADELNHWVNYYAITASSQVKEYDYDGLFIDCASHKIRGGTTLNKTPANYSDTKWRDDRYTALEFIKSYFPDKPVTYNGLHSENGAEKSLDLTDGGMWEVFAFNATTGAYEGQAEWQKVIDIAEEYKDDKLISIVTKKKDLVEEIDNRMFILGSYLLVANQNVILNMNDLNFDPSGMLLYYPEYEVDLGKPLGSYGVENNIYQREFEEGLVLVNPSENQSYSYNLDQEYNKVVPRGGGQVPEDGQWKGQLDYQATSGNINLLPASGIVLISK